MITCLFHHVIGTIHPIALVRTGIGKSLGILNTVSLIFCQGFAPPTALLYSAVRTNLVQCLSLADNKLSFLW